MRVDTNTRGHRQWFYFSIKSKAKRLIKLNIYRFKKQFSLFQRGMKPYVRSIKAKNQWKPAGKNVKYVRQKENNQYGVKKGSANFYLTFQYQFNHDEDQVFFAAGIPYTYSFLDERLLTFKQKANQTKQLNFQVELAGKSMCGLDINMLKIQHMNTSSSSQNWRKKIIAINARTHAGQASASWVLDGILQFITTNQQVIQWMKQFNISFYVMPMLNVDGTLMGNYRTGIVGDDFNRKFYSGRKQIFPQICYLKKMIFTAKKQGDILMFMDLHGHSILKNNFIYGPSESQFNHCLLRRLPFYLWHKSKFFKMSSCKFKTQKDKIQTARMYFQIKQNLLSFTCENSLGLYSANQQNFQMTKEDWQNFGSSIVQAIKNTFQRQQQLKLQKINQQNDSKISEDLRKTDTPPRKQYIQNPASSYKSIQMKKFMSSVQKSKELRQPNKQSASINKKFDSTMRIFKKPQKKSDQESNTDIFQQRKISTDLQQEPYSIQIKTRLNQIRQRFPSVTSKELKNKQTISHYLKTANKEGRPRVNSYADRNKTQDQQRKRIFERKPHFQYSKQLTDGSKNVIDDQKLQKKQYKRQIVQSVFYKKQLKQLKFSSLKPEICQIGKKLIPVQDIKKKMEQKKNKTRLNFNNSYNLKLNNNKNSPINLRASNKSQNQLQNPFSNLQVSLKDIRAERSITCDQSYLASQIQKIRQLKETQREYIQDEQNREIKGWEKEEQNQEQAIFQDDFSQNFDDSLNDQDSCSQDLDEHQKKYIIDYIRSQQNVRKDKIFQSQQSDTQKDGEDKKQADRSIGDSPADKKRKIHGFRQIVFKSTVYLSQEKVHKNESFGSKIINNKQIVASKLRKNPHKFKQSLGIIKYNSVSMKNQPEQLDEQSGLYITQKKKLNQRFTKKDNRKDPFILVSIKQKLANL